ncbi:MAG: hypothetical protein WDN44_12275 [Sphingomonas sp.]
MRWQRPSLTRTLRCWSATGPTAIPRSAASSSATIAPASPLYLWYKPGEAEPRVLPQILSQSLLRGLAAAK